MDENTNTSTTTTTTAETPVQDTQTTAKGTDGAANSTADYEAEIARLKAENAKLTKAKDNATSEAADYKKKLRASQSAEEQRAEEEKERQAAMEEELKTLRKQTATANISKKVMAFIGDEAVSNEVAEAMYGAEDVDAVIAAVQKAWVAREKALKLEYGKIPAPAAGDGAPSVTKEDVLSWSVTEQVKFAAEHPDTYNKLFPRN